MPIILTEFEERVLALNGLIHARESVISTFNLPADQIAFAAEITESIDRHSHELRKLLDAGKPNQRRAGTFAARGLSEAELVASLPLLKDDTG